jgi:two-component system, NarL family, response regulator NreC
MIRIVLADDHKIIRKGLRSLLKDEADFEVVGEATNGTEAINEVMHWSPDILILDLMMSGINGLEVINRVVHLSPSTGIVILSMHNNQGYVYEAFKSGAKGYVLKDYTAEELIPAIREVYNGKTYLGPSFK